jgi:hypothetical protein
MEKQMRAERENDPRRALGNPRSAGRVGGGSHKGHSVNFPG